MQQEYQESNLEGIKWAVVEEFCCAVGIDGDKGVTHEKFKDLVLSVPFAFERWNGDLEIAPLGGLKNLPTGIARADCERAMVIGLAFGFMGLQDKLEGRPKGKAIDGFFGGKTARGFVTAATEHILSIRHRGEHISWAEVEWIEFSQVVNAMISNLSRSEHRNLNMILAIITSAALVVDHPDVQAKAKELGLLGRQP